MKPFANKVILITGASAGIGAGVAEYFASMGPRLVLTGRDGSKLDKVKDKCLKAGLTSADVLTVAGDLTDAGFRADLMSSAVRTFGRLDVLVNNAGTAKFEPLSEPSMEGYHSILDLNLSSLVALCKLAIPHLLSTKGNIVNVSSISGMRPTVSLGAYCMSKAALDMFTSVLSLELAPKGVRVNSVNPGCVTSEINRSLDMDVEQYKEFLKQTAKMYPIGRVGTPEDVAHAVAFLASDKSSFITGERLVVDGAGRYGSGDSTE
ncbi:hypothetical protein ACOMHN_010384 [Nucella lapillus]